MHLLVIMTRSWEVVNIFIWNLTLDLILVLRLLSRDV